MTDIDETTTGDLAHAEPGGFWLRAGAYAIDNIMLGIGAGLLTFFLPAVLGVVIRLAIIAAYFTWMPVARGGQTVGKRIAGLAIVTTDGSPLTYGRAALRWVGYMASAIVCSMGFLCAPFTENKRALHDFIAGTRVVKANEISTLRKVIVIAIGALLPLVFVLGIAAAIAIPSFVGMKGKADAAMTRANLGILRNGAELYRAETGAYPDDLRKISPKYVAEFPAAKAGGAEPVATVTAYDAQVCSGASVDPAKVGGAGGWGYVADPSASCAGRVFIDSRGEDPDGKPWAGY